MDRRQAPPIFQSFSYTRGAIQGPSTWVKPRDQDDPPKQSLVLDFAYGYRSYDSRNNLHFTHRGRVLYNTAAVGVVYDMDKCTQKHFNRHDDDVWSIALHPLGRLAASGQSGKTPPLYVWDTETGTHVVTLDGFLERQVRALDFSPDGQLIAAVGGDDYNSVAVYDWQNAKLIATSKGDANKVFFLKYNPYNGSFATGGVKHVKFWNFNEEGQLIGKRGVFGRAPIATILGIDFTPERGLAATSDGNVYVFNGSACISVISNVHQGACTAVCVMEDLSFITGGMDGNLCVFSPDMRFERSFPLHARTKKPVRAIAAQRGRIAVGTTTGEIFETRRDGSAVRNVMKGHCGELWGLTLHPTQKGVAVSAGDDGIIYFWSARERRCVKGFQVQGKVKSIGFSPDGQCLAIGHETGKVEVVDVSDGHCIWFDERSRKEMISQVKFSPDGRTLCAASNDNFIDVYSTPVSSKSGTFAKRGTLTGHHSYVKQMDFSEDSSVLQSVSGDYEILFWNVKTCKQITAASSVKDVRWATFTCTLGWPVQGIFGPGQDGTDVNCAARSQGGTLVATGDDSKSVRLFRFPCVGPSADSKEYIGHAEHVTNIVFTHNDEYVFSVGGADRTVLQWKVIDDEKIAREALEKRTSQGAVPLSGSRSRRNGAPPSPTRPLIQGTFEGTTLEDALAGKLKMKLNLGSLGTGMGGGGSSSSAVGGGRRSATPVQQRPQSARPPEGRGRSSSVAGRPASAMPARSGSAHRR